MTDFFISYNKADCTWAEWIAWHLEEAGYTTVLQAWDFRPGSNFVLEMERAAQEAERTIAVLSPDYLAARFTQPEWAAAFARDPTGEKGLLVPVRVRACEPTGLLLQIIYVDLVALDEEAAKAALLAGVSRARARPSAAPGFPGAREVAERPRFPGALPPIWNLPHARNPNFTGREALLAGLRTALTSGQRAALTQAAIHGLGGVGKTQLAVEYAYRHAADYTLVWWVRAEEPVALAADLAALATPLGLPEKDDPEQPVVVAAVRRWLGQHGGWLLILDNAPNPQALRGALPQGGAGHALITSRHEAWRGVASPLLVQEWERPESVAFLQRRTGQDDGAAAAALAEELGHLPLALEQAGAYMDSTGRALAEYLELYRLHRQKLLERGRPSTDYPATVATTWEISFQQVRQASPAAAELLNLCAFLAPDDIPLPLLCAGAKHLPQSLAAAVADPLRCDEAMAALRDYSLLEVRGQNLAVHRLVQAVVRDRLAEKARQKWAAAAVRLVAEAFPSGTDPADVHTWPECARLLPHALAAAGHAEAQPVAGEATARLLNQAGLYLHGRAEFAAARDAFQRALAIDERAYGPDHPTVAIRVNNLGSVLHALGDLAGARAAYERALAIDEQAYGPDHPTVATRVNNLGGVLKSLGDLAGARAAYERALAIAEQAYGPEHPNVATLVNNLGLVLQNLGDLAGARAALERALAIDEQAYGPDHPTVAIRVNNLGSVLHDLGDLAGARAAFQRALAIDERAYGPEHPNVATFLNNLGGVLHDLGDLAGARAAYERALAIDEQAYGPEHPNVARDVNNLGGVLQALGDLAGARAALQRALAIDEQAYGPDHPNVATLVNNLGLVLQNLGDLAGARAALERALAIDEQAYGPEHPNVARDVNNLGMVLKDLGDLAGARAALQRALAIDEQAYGPDHPTVATDVNNLGTVLHALGDSAGALAAFQRALAIRQKFLGDDHPATVRVRNSLAALDNSGGSP